ncbi:MAG: M28 family peptidase, partial [Pseudobdellovibrio sp.]
MKKIYLISLGLAALFITHNISAADAVETPKKWDDFTAQSSLLSNAKQITFVGPRSGEGYFSADGKKMIYQSEREEGNPFYQMFILDFATGKSNRISVGTGMTTCGWVHPSLKKAMWSSTHLDPNFKDKVKSELADR